MPYPYSRRIIEVCAVVVIASHSATPPAWSQDLRASVDTDGYSFSLGPASTSAGTTISFTTFDSSMGVPLQDCAGGVCFRSQEAAPFPIGSTDYLTDYFASDASGIFEDGAVALVVDASDSNGDGVLDPLRRTASGNFSFAGLTVPYFNVFGSLVNLSIAGSVVRSAGANVGTYSGTLSSASTPMLSFTGSFALSGVSGSVDYQLGGSTLSWDLANRGVDGTTRRFTGLSEFERIGTTAIHIPAFSLADSGTGFLLVLTRPCTLNRSGT
jgi:hypothetical protein